MLFRSREGRGGEVGEKRAGGRSFQSRGGSRSPPTGHGLKGAWGSRGTHIMLVGHPPLLHVQHLHLHDAAPRRHGLSSAGPSAGAGDAGCWGAPQRAGNSRPSGIRGLSVIQSPVRARAAAAALRSARPPAPPPPAPGPPPARPPARPPRRRPAPPLKGPAPTPAPGARTRLAHVRPRQGLCPGGEPPRLGEGTGAHPACDH